MKLFSELEQTDITKTAMSCTIKKWIPQRSADGLWGMFPTITSTNQEIIDKVIEKCWLQEKMHSMEQELSKFGRYGLTISEKIDQDGELMPVVCMGTVKNAVYDDCELVYMEIERELNPFGDTKYKIFEKLDKNKTIRQIQKDGVEILPTTLANETGITINTKWVHNKGVVMGWVETNKMTIKEYAETADLWMVNGILPLVDKVFNATVRELDYGGSQYYLRTPLSNIKQNDLIALQYDNQLKNGGIFMLNNQGGNTSTIGINQTEINFKQANYRATLPHLNASQDQILSTLLTFIADKEYSFENVGTVQQSSLERGQVDNAKILSLNAKSSKRTKMLKGIFNLFNAINQDIPTDIEVEFNIKPAYASELTNAMNGAMQSQQEQLDSRGGDNV